MLYQSVRGNQNEVPVARRIEKSWQLQDSLSKLRARHVRSGQKRGAFGATERPVAGYGTSGQLKKNAFDILKSY